MYIEVKGYKRPRDLAKWKALDNLFVIEQKEINNLDSVIEGLMNKR